MTGVNAHSLLRNSNLDSMQLRYWKVKENTKRFLPIQMGICSFEITPERNILAYPFNFYIYPLPIEESVDKRFLCQSSALHFLSNHDFDFNKLFYDGIYYLNREDMNTIEASKSTLSIKKKLFEMSKSISPEMHAFTKLSLPKVEEFIKDPNANHFELEIKFIKAKVYRHFESNVKKYFPNQPLNIQYDHEDFFKRSKMIITKISEEELKQLKETEASQQPETPEEIDPVGFRKVLDYLTELQLPLVVHNGFLDMCHLQDKFFYSLPETHREFKMMLKKEFPVIYDTKYMHNNSNILAAEVGNHMDLSSIYKKLLKYHQSEPIIDIAPGFSDYKLLSIDEESFASHEAGYDALITGYVFFKSLGILNLYNSLFDKTFVKRMKFYENKIPLGGIKVPFNLNYEDDIYKDTTLVFYLENKQATLSFEEIKKYFEENFGNANLYPVYGDRLEYFLIFQKHDAGVKLNNWLNQKNGEGDIYMNSTEGKAIIQVKSFEKYENYLREKITGDLDKNKMPEFLEIIGQ